MADFISNHTFGEMMNIKGNRINIVIKILITFMILSVILPLVYMFVVSLKSKNDFLSSPYDIINFEWTFENYSKMFTSYNVQQKLWNSFWVSSLTASLVCVFAIPAAYCMLYIKESIRKIVIVLMVIFIFMPAQVALAAKYRLFLEMGLIDTHFAVIVSGLSDWLPTSIFLMYVHIRGLNKGFINAAKLDGCNECQVIIRILIPIILPAISIIFINTFTGMWNDFLTPMFLLRSESKQLLIPSLTSLVQRYRSNLPFQLSGYVCGIIPTIIIYTIFKNYILNGFKE